MSGGSTQRLRLERERKKQLSGTKNETLIQGSSCVHSLKGHPDVFFPGWDVCVNRFRCRYQKSNFFFLFVCYQICLPRWAFPSQVWCIWFRLSAHLIIYLKPKFRSKFKQCQLETCQIGNLFPASVINCALFLDVLSRKTSTQHWHIANFFSWCCYYKNITTYLIFVQIMDLPNKAAKFEAMESFVPTIPF